MLNYLKTKNYMLSMDVRKNAWVQWIEDFKKRKVSSTVLETLSLFKKGKTIAQIAKERDFKAESVEKQLHELIVQGLLRCEDVIGLKKKEEILSKLTPKTINALTSIKDAVGEKISYFEIKCVLAELVVIPKEV